MRGKPWGNNTGKLRFIRFINILSTLGFPINTNIPKINDFVARWYV